MIAKFRRLLFTIRTFKNYTQRLSRCVDVENILLDVANGKREMLTKQECRELAFKLAGVGK